MTMRGWRASSSSAARWPRWDEPLSTIQNTRRAEWYGSWFITSSTNRPKAVSLAVAANAMAIDSGLTCLRFATAKDHCAMDIPSRQVLQDACTLVLVFNAHGLVRSDWQGRMQPATDLDAGLLISTQHVFVRPEWPTLPLTGVQVQHRASQLQEVPITWKDPGPIPPGTPGVVCQQAPDGSARGRDFLAREAV